MAEKNGFDITKLIFQNMCEWQCGAVVKEFLASADEPGSTPGDVAFSVSLYSFIIIIILIIILIIIIIIILFSICFLALFFLLACFSLFVLLTLLIMHLDQYIF